MKPSAYNVLVEGADGETLIYNTLKRSFAALGPEALACYKAMAGDAVAGTAAAAANSSASADTYVRDLVSAGFLVEDPQWEKDIQEKQFDEDRANTSWLSITIMPTTACNLACPYCYERGHKHPGTIGEDVIEATYDFFERVFERNHFETFDLCWYGGEATLCMDIIERVTAEFRRRCDEKGVEFSVGIGSNCTDINADMANHMADIGVKYMMPSIDGMHDTQNCRRYSPGGKDTFEGCMNSIANCRSAGINVAVNMNSDKVNLPEFEETRKYISDRFGPEVEIYPSLLKDYCCDYNQNSDGFNDESYSLFTREEYAHAIHDLFKRTPYTREALEELLRPMRNFCSCELDGTYAIAPNGDVYRCVGWLGSKDHCYFNVLDRPSLDQIRSTGYNPLRDPECRDCAYEPLCKGECRWDRATMKDGCHISRYVLGDYLKDYREFFGDSEGEFTLFVEPIDVEQFLTGQYYRDAPDESIWAGSPTYGHDEEGRPLFTKGTFFLDTEKIREEGRFA